MFIKNILKRNSITICSTCQKKIKKEAKIVIILDGIVIILNIIALSRLTYPDIL